MKLVLASKEKFLLDHGYSLLGLPREKLKIGFVRTALNEVKDQEYLNYMEEYFDLMANSGIDFKQFDIKGKSEEEIMGFFSDRNVIQVSGGNPFYLLKAIRETNFDLVLKKLLALSDESALSYVPFLLKCHFQDKQKEEMIERAKTLKYPLKVLKDDQCLYIENGRISFVGESEEVII